MPVLSRDFIGISIGLSAGGFGVIRASKCWTLASRRSCSKFERSLHVLAKGFPPLSVLDGSMCSLDDGGRTRLNS